MKLATKGLASVYVCYISFNAIGYSNGRLAEPSIFKTVETETTKKLSPIITDYNQIEGILSKEVDHILIPNTYCDYYEYGGDGDCDDGLPFDQVWKMCLDDQDQKCMGVMWNSCNEEDTNDISVNGAWKLMTPGQIIGDENNPTETCGGKEQALGHWSVFVRSDMYLEGDHPTINRFLKEYYDGGKSQISTW